MAQIIIIGGGMAGCTTAIRLAKDGHNIIIIEELDDILRGTSEKTPGRMGLGYHYFDLKTAKMYAAKTLKFMTEYQDCFIGSNSEPYLQVGRYFILKESLVDYQDLMVNFDRNQAETILLLNKDPKARALFKEPIIHRALLRDEFESDVSKEKVAYAIETQEQLLDWNKFSLKLRGQIADMSDKIKIQTNCKIIDGTSHGDSFNLISSNGSMYNSKYVVNCSWQNIEFLDRKLDIPPSLYPQEITSRLKLLAEVRLPEPLRKRPSMFFCVGPFAMFSNLGNGIGRITYAPVTNYIMTNEDKMPEEIERLLQHGLERDQVINLGQAIIDGVANYIPAMKDAVLIRVLPGIVKSIGDVDIYNKHSKVHERNYSGVQERRMGWINNAAIKLLHGPSNADEVAQIIDCQIMVRQQAHDYLYFNFGRTLGDLFYHHAQESCHKELSGTLTEIIEVHSLKQLVNQQISPHLLSRL